MSNFQNIARAKLSASGRESARVRHLARAKVKSELTPGTMVRSRYGGGVYSIDTVTQSGTGRDYCIRLNTGSEYTPARFWEVFDLVE